MKEIDILVIPREKIPQEVFARNFLRMTRSNLDDMLRHAEYRWRPDMEEDDSFKQIIPYVVIVTSGGILTYRRGIKGNEERLHSLYSVGVGGHVDAPDSFDDAMHREIVEEIGMDIPAEKCELLGVINDDTNDVGRVHIGIVMAAYLSDVDLTKGEKDVLDEKTIMLLDSIVSIYNTSETWTKIVIDECLPLIRR